MAADDDLNDRLVAPDGDQTAFDAHSLPTAWGNTTETASPLHSTEGRRRDPKGRRGRRRAPTDPVSPAESERDPRAGAAPDRPTAEAIEAEARARTDAERRVAELTEQLDAVRRAAEAEIRTVGQRWQAADAQFRAEAKYELAAAQESQRAAEAELEQVAAALRHTITERDQMAVELDAERSRADVATRDLTAVSAELAQAVDARGAAIEIAELEQGRATAAEQTAAEALESLEALQVRFWQTEDQRVAEAARADAAVAGPGRVHRGAGRGAAAASAG